MKKCLYILLIINILTIAYGFFAILSASVIYAVILLGLGILQLVPIIAIISCIDNIEELHYQNTKLFYKLKKLDEEVNGTQNRDEYIPAVTNSDSAKATWECVKCGTVNKPDTTCCSNCKAPYSPFINPTDNPYAKKKISRWVKFK